MKAPKCDENLSNLIEIYKSNVNDKRKTYLGNHNSEKNFTNLIKLQLFD